MKMTREEYREYLSRYSLPELLEGKRDIENIYVSVHHEIVRYDTLQLSLDINFIENPASWQPQFLVSKEEIEKLEELKKYQKNILKVLDDVNFVIRNRQGDFLCESSTL